MRALPAQPSNRAGPDQPRHTSAPYDHCSELGKGDRGVTFVNVSSQPRHSRLRRQRVRLGITLIGDVQDGAARLAVHGVRFVAT